MIVEYNDNYKNNLKQLLVELQEYIVSIDYEKYNIITDKYGEFYLDKTLKEVQKYDGKIFLYKEDENILGAIVCCVNNESEKTYDFKAPKRGRITEFIVTQSARSKGIGKMLLDSCYNYLKSIGCADVLLSVFAYNKSAINYYEKNGYHDRLIEMTKKL